MNNNSNIALLLSRSEPVISSFILRGESFKGLFSLNSNPF